MYIYKIYIYISIYIYIQNAQGPRPPEPKGPSIDPMIGSADVPYQWQKGLSRTDEPSRSANRSNAKVTIFTANI